jgi:hypothetical protein
MDCRARNISESTTTDFIFSPWFVVQAEFLDGVGYKAGKSDTPRERPDALRNFFLAYLSGS